ncbi:unnamed protein product [Absidia cylindrospora]
MWEIKIQLFLKCRHLVYTLPLFFTHSSFSPFYSHILPHTHSSNIFKTMRIAAVQFYTDFSDTENNWKRAETYLEKAAKEKVDCGIPRVFSLWIKNNIYETTRKIQFTGN